MHDKPQHGPERHCCRCWRRHGTARRSACLLRRGVSWIPARCQARLFKPSLTRVHAKCAWVGAHPRRRDQHLRRATHLLVLRLARLAARGLERHHLGRRWRAGAHLRRGRSGGPLHPDRLGPRGRRRRRPGCAAVSPRAHILWGRLGAARTKLPGTSCSTPAVAHQANCSMQSVREQPSRFLRTSRRARPGSDAPRLTPLPNRVEVAAAAMPALALVCALLFAISASAVLRLRPLVPSSPPFQPAAFLQIGECGV